MTREICKLCGDISRVGFRVPDSMWERVTQGRWNVLCLRCFTRLADENGLAWDKDIKFFPVSFVTHSKRVAWGVRVGDYLLVPEDTP